MVYPDVGFNLMSLRDANLKSKSAESKRGRHRTKSISCAPMSNDF
jgi:hypothetical protein